jgi:Tfp pilus assembly protein PilO
MTVPSIREWMAALRSWMGHQPNSVRIGLIVGLVGLVWIFYLPSLKDIRWLMRQRAELKSNVEQDRRTLLEFQEVPFKTLAHSHELPEILNRLRMLATEHKVRILAITPQAAKEGYEGLVEMVPVEMELEGGYQNLGEFVGAFTRFPEIPILVKRIQIGRQAQRLPNLRMALSLELALLSGKDAS